MEAEDYSFYQGLEFLLTHDIKDLGYDLTFSTEVCPPTDCKRRVVCTKYITAKWTVGQTFSADMWLHQP